MYSTGCGTLYLLQVYLILVKSENRIGPCEIKLDHNENKIAFCKNIIGLCENRIGPYEIRFYHCENKIGSCKNRIDPCEI